MTRDSPDQPEADIQISRKIAVLDYEAAKEEGIERLKFQNELANSVLKNLLLINGGAIVALLTFVGNVETDLSRVDLKSSFVSFATGCTFCVLAYICGFFAGERFHDATISEAWNAQLRMSGEIPRHPALAEIKCGRRIYNTAICFVVASISAFVFGAYLAMDALL